MTAAAGTTPTRPVWRIEAARSIVTFHARILGLVRVRGGFPTAVTGTVAASGETVSGTATLDVRALRTGIGRRDRHLLSAEFLDAERHPSISLRVDGVPRRAGRQRATALVTVKGVTTSVPVEVELTETPTSLDAIVRGTLRRRDVQIVPSRIADRAVDDEFGFEAHITTAAG